MEEGLQQREATQCIEQRSTGPLQDRWGLYLGLEPAQKLALLAGQDRGAAPPTTIGHYWWTEIGVNVANNPCLVLFVSSFNTYSVALAMSFVCAVNCVGNEER